MSNYIGITPRNIEDAYRLSKCLASSSLVPSHFKGRPDDILVALQMGAEVGLKPMQSLQNIAIIKGRATLWGDAMMALVKMHPDLEDVKEYMETDEIAICKIKRKNQTEHVCKFSKEDAVKAHLWGKNAWSTYPKRMLQMRARAFALRDTFPDALCGIQMAEEVRDYQNNTENKKEEPIKIEEKPTNRLLKGLKDGNIEQVEKMQALWFKEGKISEDDAEFIRTKIEEAKSEKKALEKTVVVNGIKVHEIMQPSEISSTDYDER